MGICKIDKEAKNENKIVESWLLWYHERKQTYEELRAELESIRSSCGYVIAKPPEMSDPTARRVVELVDKLAHMEKWLKLVEDVERNLPWKMQIFLRLRRDYRYARGRRGWTAAVQWKFASEVAERLGKEPEDTWVESRNTFTEWWNRIVEYAVRLALRRGLLQNNTVS